METTYGSIKERRLFRVLAHAASILDSGLTAEELHKCTMGQSTLQDLGQFVSEALKGRKRTYTLKQAVQVAENMDRYGDDRYQFCAQLSLALGDFGLKRLFDTIAQKLKANDAALVASYTAALTETGRSFNHERAIREYAEQASADSIQSVLSVLGKALKTAKEREERSAQVARIARASVTAA